MKKLAIIRGNCFNEVILERYKPLENYLKIKYYATQKTKNELVTPVKTYHNILLRALGLHYYQPSIYRELDKFKPDIINSIELYNYYSYASVKWAKENKKKSVIFCWETLPDHPVFRKTIFRNYFTNYVIKNADIFHVVTSKSKQCLLKLGADENKIITQKVGINTDRFKPGLNQELRKKLGLKKKTVLFIGRLTYEKGIIQLIKAFKELEKDYELIIIGDGELKDYVKKNTSNNIKYLGKVPFNEIHNYFNCAHVFTLPSIPHKLWEEQFGEVIPQAMSSGIPTVTTLSGAIPEIISEKEGELITPLSVNELRDALKKLLSNDKLRKEKGINARKRAIKEYDYKKNNYELFKNIKKTYKLL